MKKIFFFLLFVFFLIQPVWVQASLVPCGLHEDDPSTWWNETCECTLCHLWLLGKRVIDFLTLLSIPVATLIFVVAGVILLTSGDSEQRREKGKDMITKAVIGLIIVFASWLLVGSVLNTLAKKRFSVGWNKFECVGYNLSNCQSIGNNPTSGGSNSGNPNSPNSGSSN